MKHTLLIVTLSLVVPALHAGLGSPGVPQSTAWNPQAVRLAEAVRQGNVSQVQHLLASGVSPNAADATPMFLAISKGDEVIVRALLNAGANPNLAPRGRDPLLTRAVIQCHGGIVAALLAAGALTEAVSGGEGAHGFTPLVVAVNSRVVKGVRNNDVIIRRLLRAGANPNATSAALRGVTPLMGASGFECVPLMYRLLAAGARINATNDYGMTALMIAAKKGKGEAVRVLLAAGADRTITDSNGATALAIAMQYNHEAIVCLLEEQIEGH